MGRARWIWILAYSIVLWWVIGQGLAGTCCVIISATLSYWLSFESLSPPLAMWATHFALTNDHLTGFFYRTVMVVGFFNYHCYHCLHVRMTLWLLFFLYSVILLAVGLRPMCCQPCGHHGANMNKLIPLLCHALMGWAAMHITYKHAKHLGLPGSLKPLCIPVMPSAIWPGTEPRAGPTLIPT